MALVVQYIAIDSETVFICASTHRNVFFYLSQCLSRNFLNMLTGLFSVSGGGLFQSTTTLQSTSNIHGPTSMWGTHLFHSPVGVPRLVRKGLGQRSGRKIGTRRPCNVWVIHQEKIYVPRRRRHDG